MPVIETNAGIFGASIKHVKMDNQKFLTFKCFEMWRRKYYF